MSDAAPVERVDSGDNDDGGDDDGGNDDGGDDDGGDDDGGDDGGGNDDGGNDDGGNTEPWLDGVARVEAAAWSLACRRARKLSQRELAAAAGLSPGMIQRLELGTGRAAYDTVARVLAASGYELIAVDSLGRVLRTDDVAVGPIDRAGRRLPVHLDPQRTRPYLGPRPDDYTPYDLLSWWGWHRIAWWDGHPKVPPWTYHKRRR